MEWRGKHQLLVLDRLSGGGLEDAAAACGDLLVAIGAGDVEAFLGIAFGPGAVAFAERTAGEVTQLVDLVENTLGPEWFVDFGGEAGPWPDTYVGGLLTGLEPYDEVLTISAGDRRAFH